VVWGSERFEEEDGIVFHRLSGRGMITTHSIIGRINLFGHSVGVKSAAFRGSCILPALFDALGNIGATK
jgi:hypothetical protein